MRQQSFTLIAYRRSVVENKLKSASARFSVLSISSINNQLPAFWLPRIAFLLHASDGAPTMVYEDIRRDKRA